MPFPRRLLGEGEDLVFDLRPHWIALLLPVAEAILIVGAFLAALVYTPDSWPSWVRWVEIAVAVVLFLVGPVPPFVAWATSHFVVTTDRVIHRSGWIAKHSMEIPVERISDVKFNQSVFERMIGAGDIILESAGEFGQETFGDIRNPELVQKRIYEMAEANQQEMVPHAAQASVADELSKLDRLRDDGVISSEEFEAQKARLLGRQ
ncbi:MAG TPA: PH domain-containing protein [Actinomycetota bacterium]|jgi:uncharacterized membrane protein YdbT with pleckstrin-like domain